MLKKAGKWIGKRAKERTTYTGVAVILSMLGAQKLGVQIDQIGQAVGLIVGGGLIATQADESQGS